MIEILVGLYVVDNDGYQAYRDEPAIASQFVARTNSCGEHEEVDVHGVAIFKQ